MFDLLIKNGHLFDPGESIDCTGDIAVSCGKIEAIGKIRAEEGETVIDVHGNYILPGLIDHHAHVNYRGNDFSMPAEIAHFPNGVTTVVDGGSTGVSGFESFYCNVVTSAVIRIKSYLHVSSIGQTRDCTLEDADPQKMDEKRILSVCSKYRDNIIGLKVKQNKPVVKEFGLRPLMKAVEIAEKAGLRLSVHASDSPGEIEEILRILRPGDIFCHMFHQQGKTILDERGMIQESVRKARERGILFEVAHGSMQFSAKVAKAALRQKFFPDIVSSDLSLLALYKVPNYSFTYVMSELLNLGMTLEDIVKACTAVPAKLTGESDLGKLTVGSKGDLFICDLVEKQVTFQDKYGNTFKGSKLIRPLMTVKDGMIVYRAYDFF